jgi:hypothetical protein
MTQRFPVLTAAGLYTAAVALAFLPFFRGQFLVNAMSDARTGFPGRELAAAYYQPRWHTQWMPYTWRHAVLANTGNGDPFTRPSSCGWCCRGRRVSLGFDPPGPGRRVLFLFLRALQLDWGAAFAGGATYLMSGQIVSLVSPGHDGKLFVSALLPLALYFLYKGVTSASWRNYVGFGVTVGLSLITPHVTDLLPPHGAGFFPLVFLSGDAPPAPPGQERRSFAGALVLGFSSPRSS